jgi:hypothetical protein
LTSCRALPQLRRCCYSLLYLECGSLTPALRPRPSHHPKAAPALPKLKSHRGSPHEIVSRCHGRVGYTLCLRPIGISRMKPAAVTALLGVLSLASSIPVRAQGTGAAEYGRQTQIEWKKQQKLAGKSGRKYRKAMKKNAKAQRKAAKQAAKKTNHHAG